MAQDDPHLNIDGLVQAVFPIRRDLRVRSLPQVPIDCKCPSGTHSVWFVVDEFDDEYHVADRACGGSVKKTDVYSETQVKEMEIDHLKDTDKDLWLKSLIARRFLLDNTTASNQQSVIIYNSILESRPNDLSFLMHRAMSKFQLSLLDSALLDLDNASKINGSLYELSYLTGLTLFHKGKLTAAIKHLELSYSKTPNRSETLVLICSCLRSMGRYDDILDRLDSIDKIKDTSCRNSAFITRAEAFVVANKPNLEMAIKDFEYVEDNIEGVSFIATVNISIINSTRPDVSKRDIQAALKSLATLEGSAYFDANIKDYHLALCLAYLNGADYGKASEVMRKLDAMFLDDDDFKQLREIRECIEKKQAYVPSGKIPISIFALP